MFQNQKKENEIMNGLTMTKGLDKSRGRRMALAAAVLASLILLSLTPVHAQDKAIRILYKARIDPIGLTSGQTLRLNLVSHWLHPILYARTSAKETYEGAQRSTVRSVIVVFDGQNNAIARTEV